MPDSCKQSLNEDLRELIKQISCDDADTVTPTESVRPAIGRPDLQQQAAVVREAILEGYRDAIAGRTVEFRGDLKALL